MVLSRGLRKLRLQEDGIERSLRPVPYTHLSRNKCATIPLYLPDIIHILNSDLDLDACALNNDPSTFPANLDEVGL